jgi:arginyl-tRNA synthetase
MNSTRTHNTNGYSKKKNGKGKKKKKKRKEKKRKETNKHLHIDHEATVRYFTANKSSTTFILFDFSALIAKSNIPQNPVISLQYTKSDTQKNRCGHGCGKKMEGGPKQKIQRL